MLWGSGFTGNPDFWLDSCPDLREIGKSVCVTAFTVIVWTSLRVDAKGSKMCATTSGDTTRTTRLNKSMIPEPRCLLHSTTVQLRSESA